MSTGSRLSNGWKISMNSFKVLKANKQLIIFPILSGASIVILMASFIFVTVFSTSLLSRWFDSDNSPFLGYFILFCFYIINYFIAAFFNVALMHSLKMYFNGDEINLQQSLNFSFSRIGVIFGWSVIAATVGTILKIIQEETGVVGKIITGIIGIIWNVATFFVIPVLAYENVGPIDAISKSAKTMKEKWGESLAGNFSFGLVQIAALLVIAVPLFLLGSLINTFVGMILAVLSSIFILVIISAAQGIFISAVYHRVNGQEVSFVNNEMVDDLFRKKAEKKMW